MPVVWLSPIVAPQHVGSTRSISAAANRWQLALIDALAHLGIATRIVSHRPERIWPLGLACPTFPNRRIGPAEVEFARYLNLPGLREWSVRRSTEQLARERLRADDVVVTYNTELSARLLLHCRQRLRTKWISIVADGEPYEGADATIFLSGQAYRTSAIRAKIHFEGGLDPYVPSQPDLRGSRVLLYAGDFSDLTGFREFAVEFSRYARPDVELHVYGKTPPSGIAQVIAACPRIIYHGFVGPGVLAERMRTCFAFASPRNSRLEAEMNTFPSKLLQYASFGKPIITPDLASVPARYDGLLIKYSPGVAGSLQAALDRIARTSADEWRRYQDFSAKLVAKRAWVPAVRELVHELAAVGISPLSACHAPPDRWRNVATRVAGGSVSPAAGS